MTSGGSEDRCQPGYSPPQPATWMPLKPGMGLVCGTSMRADNLPARFNDHQKGSKEISSAYFLTTRYVPDFSCICEKNCPCPAGMRPVKKLGQIDPLEISDTDRRRCQDPFSRSRARV